MSAGGVDTYVQRLERVALELAKRPHEALHGAAAGEGPVETPVTVSEAVEKG